MPCYISILSPTLRKILLLCPRWLLLGMLLAFGATVTAAPNDAQQSADVQRLIQNDEDVAAVKKQLAAKQISNVDYTRRLQELTKTRNDILSSYDRAAQRNLIALYNATKKDMANTARQAAAEQAQAARQAALEKSAADAKAKADAAQQAETSKKEAIQSDARAYIDLAMRHDQLVVKENIQGSTEAEKKLMSEYSEQGNGIRNKYARGAPLAAETNNFAAAIQQLDKELVAPAAKEWVANTLPGPDAIIAGYNTDEERVAGLRFMNRVLRDNIAAPWPDAANQKSAQYLAAADKIDPPSGEKHPVVAAGADKLFNDPEFRIQFVKKFLGAYGVPYAIAAQESIRAAKARAEWRVINFRSNLIFLAVLLTPILYLLKGQRSKSKKAPASSNDPFALPESLRVVKVFRKSYPVDFESGQIYEKEIWTETTSTTVTTPGSVPSQGMPGTPASTTTTTQTTVYHRYWIRTPDGREVWQKFSDNVFPAAISQIISSASFKTDIIIAYNHVTRSLVPLKPGLRAANRLPGRWLWLASSAVGIVGFLILRPPGNDPHYINPDGQPWNHLVSAGIFGSVIGSLIFVTVLKCVVQFIRGWQFKRNYLPRVREFLPQLTPKLVEHYRNEPIAGGLIEKA